METDDMLTVAEAAAALGISERGVRKRLESNVLQGQNIGGRIWLVPRTEVERWRELGKLKPGPKQGSQRRRTASDSSDAFEASRPGEQPGV